MSTKQEEGNLILKLYEIRRDGEFRKAREWFDTQFNPQSAQEILDLFQSGFANTAYFRMVMSYWEMVAALANHGAIDPHLIHSTNVEHLRYYAKLEPFIAEVREGAGEEFLAELEKLVKTAPNFKQRLAGWQAINQNWANNNNKKAATGQGADSR